ncbi:hypothetical protein F442_11688 [Phytophthora nicotianae P10297]|uniref:Uncharacterized protein n=1 Tax=Phytophthora nicotianae P10297 TaxID=1317064 RepID=W2Z1E5_PHYNI|nr:hypothetical protein F442_11688 [Phytophthora nicotianae P10297]
MEPLNFDIVDNDELLAEALAILDSIDVNRLGAAAPESPRVAQEIPDEKAAADDLLKTAIEAVHAAFSHNGLNSSRVPTATTMLQEHKPIAPEQLHDNQDEIPNVNHQLTRSPLRVQTETGSTEAMAPTSQSSGGGRIRMREQLIQLRLVVQKMENHLETLRSPRSPRFGTHANYLENEEVVRNRVVDENDRNRKNVPEHGSDITAEAAVWRNIAMQQFRARRKAEQQNVELRKNLATQIQLSKQVEDLLQAQPPHPVSTTGKKQHHLLPRRSLLLFCDSCLV